MRQSLANREAGRSLREKTAHCTGAAARDDKLDTRAEPCAPREACGVS